MEYENNENQNGQDYGEEIVYYRTNLEKIMKQRGMLQKELAEKANIELYQISQLCSGKKTNIMLDTAKRICKVLKCSLDKAFGDTN